MLLVNASAGPSKIHGTGLIARAPIMAGSIVWEFRPGFDLAMTSEEVRNLSPWSHAQVRRFLYVDIATGRSVLCSDDAKYMNHSDDPNTRTIGTQTIASRHIDIGEELTCDYAEFDAATRARQTHDTHTGHLSSTAAPPVRE